MMNRVFPRRILRPWLAAGLLAATLIAPLSAQDSARGPAQDSDASNPSTLGAIVGRVVEDDGHGVVGARVSVLDTRWRSTTLDDGDFRFDDVPAGEYLVFAESSTAGSGVSIVEVAAGAEAMVEVQLDISTVRDEVVVTASAVARRAFDIAQPTSVLSGEELDLRRDVTLGETLDEQPGVSSTYFGPGAGRPLIRGIGGDRVRMLSDGLGSGDASSLSPDHAVSIDPSVADRIEILRGPATLLYGSSAVGGVVNVLDGRVPDFVPEVPITGSIEGTLGSGADERTATAEADGGQGRFAWHVDFMSRETNDYEIPGHAELEEQEHRGEDEDDEPGILPNSALETDGGAVGVSWVGDKSYLGVSLSGFDTLYGVPGHAQGEEGHDGEQHAEQEGGAVRIDLEQRRIDLRGQIGREFGLFRGLKLRFARSDYEHVELEGNEVGTRFLNDGFEGRLELAQKPLETRAGRLTGSLGLQAIQSDFAAIGEEAFVPPSITDSLAVFAYQELSFGRDNRHAIQFGGRFETQSLDPKGNLPNRSFDGVSLSAGTLIALDEAWVLAGNISRNERLPNATELYADGPHAATRAFEIGDLGLDKETSLGVDLSLRRRSGRVTGSLGVFVNRFDDYIYESFTGEVEDGLDVIRFVQRDAEFSGAELAALIDLIQGHEQHLALNLSVDSVRAELRGGIDDGEPLPRITPLRFGASLDFHKNRFHGFFEVRRVNKQDRVAANETPTDGYTLVNGSLSYRFLIAGNILDLILRGRNLGDKEARVHTSLLKNEAPLPGRDVSLAVRWTF